MFEPVQKARFGVRSQLYRRNAGCNTTLSTHARSPTSIPFLLFPCCSDESGKVTVMAQNVSVILDDMGQSLERTTLQLSIILRKHSYKGRWRRRKAVGEACRGVGHCGRARFGGARWRGEAPSFLLSFSSPKFDSSIAERHCVAGQLKRHLYARERVRFLWKKILFPFKSCCYSFPPTMDSAIERQDVLEQQGLRKVSQRRKIQKKTDFSFVN